MPYEQQTELAVEAARLGFDYITTNETPGETDAFQICLMRWLATKDVVPGGITNAISVSPAGMRNPVGLAMSAMTPARSAAASSSWAWVRAVPYREAYRRMWGKTGYPVVVFRDQLGNRHTEFWVFDMASKKLVTTLEFLVRLRSSSRYPVRGRTCLSMEGRR